MRDGEEIVRESFAGRERDNMLDGEERDSMLDGEETVEIACGEFRWKERDSMLDGQETVQIARGKLWWEGARQYAGRTGNRANSLRKASVGGSKTACWTERKGCK